MIIVNTTFVLHADIADQLIPWIKDTYAESAQHRGASEIKPLLTRVLGQDTTDTVTYALHIYFPDLESAERWNEGFGAGLRRVLSQRWGERALTFHTFLEVTE